MKQIIRKNYDGSIYNKFYKNHLNQFNGLNIGYRINGNISWKFNYLNGKRFGLNNKYGTNAKPIEIKYHL